MCLLLVSTLASVTRATFAQAITLGAGVESQSPEGSLIKVNGVFIAHEGRGVGWYYDWGDGSESTGYFPTLHRYESPGAYEVTVTGFNDLGDSATTTFVHTVTEPETSEVASVELSDYSLGLHAGEARAVTVTPYDASGNPLPLISRTVDVYSIEPQSVAASYQDGELTLTASVFPNRDAWSSTVYVYVDGQESYRPIHVIANGNEGAFGLLDGVYTASYLPVEFFTSSDVSDEDYERILDLAFEMENESVSGGWVEEGKVLQGISYAPPVFGASGHPLLLGDAALPQDGAPFFDVIIHEMGHNFHSIPVLLNNIAVPGAFYQETIAEWYVQYVLNRVIEERAAELGSDALEVLEQIRQRGRGYHAFEFQQYLDRGMPFDYFSTIDGSHPLVQKIYEYSDVHGWGKLDDFMSRFDHLFMAEFGAVLSQHGGLEPIANRVTIMAAALSATFEFDVRPDFHSLAFPINDALHTDLLDIYGTSVDTPGHPEPGEQGVRYGLLSNHPNPFASATRVAFNVPGAGRVKIEVYDVLGRSVALLLDEYTTAGVHGIRWNAVGLTAGTYVLRLQAGDVSDMRTVTLVE